MPGNRTIARAVAAGAVVAAGVAAAAQPARDAPDPGRAPYSRAQCDYCHGPTGLGAMGPGLVPFAKSPAYLRFVVRQGIGLMPPHAPAVVSDADIEAIYRFLARRPPGGGSPGAAGTPGRPSGGAAGRPGRRPANR